MNLELEKAKIAEIFGVSKQKVYYLMKIRIKTERKLTKKLDKKKFDKYHLQQKNNEKKEI